ncbi:MAG: cysteine hydrolase [Candidatus Obscuribacterales bacterium]|nr:cysteine hydrolase [Candidatus Obscuribacterales bacterium]
MKNYTLVVVDMQPHFVASNNRLTQSYVAIEIERAKANGMAIVFLEIPYLSPLDEVGYKPTHQSLLKLVRGYDKAKVWTKSDNGGQRLLDACQHHGFTKKRFRICGVNTELCVLSLVRDLLVKSPSSKLKVVARACNTCYPQKDPFAHYPKNEKLRIVHRRK